MSLAFSYSCGIELEENNELFDSLKAWLILRGKEDFLRIYKRPDDLADFDNVEPDQILLKTCPSEWFRRYQKELPVRRKWQSIKGSPKTRKEAMKFVDGLEDNFPKLFRKFPDLRALAWHPQDRVLIWQLLESGTNLKLPKVVDHYFVCDNSRSRGELINHLNKSGFKITSHKDSSYVTAAQTTSILELTRKTQDMLDLADKYQCVYDGWGTTQGKSQAV